MEELVSKSWGSTSSDVDNNTSILTQKTFVDSSNSDCTSAVALGLNKDLNKDVFLSAAATSLDGSGLGLSLLDSVTNPNDNQMDESSVDGSMDTEGYTTV